MKVVNSTQFPTRDLVDYTCDELFLISVHRSQHAEITIIDPESLEIGDIFTIDAEPHEFYGICSDSNFLYLPTKLGQILAIDKFSGELIHTIQSSTMPIMSSIEQDDEFLYCIYGIPINTKYSLLLSKYCLCSFNKTTGRKNIQTNYFEGPPVFCTADDHLWTIAGKNLSCYRKTGELINQIGLREPPDFKPLVTEDHVICIYRHGLVKIFRKKTMTMQSVVGGKPTVSAPKMLSNSELCWLTQNGLYYINIKEQVFKEIKSNKKMNSSLAHAGQYAFGCDDEGCIHSFNTRNNEVHSIKLTDEKLWKPLIIQNQLLVISDDHLHKIEMSK